MCQIVYELNSVIYEYTAVLLGRHQNHETDDY